MATFRIIKWPGFLRDDRFLLALVCLLMLAKRFLLLPYGFNYEEGKELEAALDVMAGKLIYRDFFWHYGPIAPYFTAFLFKLSGKIDILIPRGMVSVAAVAMTYYAYRTARFYLSSSWAFWAALMASSGLVAREHTYGHIFAYLGMIGSCYYLLRFFRSENARGCLIASGFFVFLALISKPVMFGVGAVAAGLFCLGLWTVVVKGKPCRWQPFGWFAVSSLLPAFLVYGFLYWNTPRHVFLACLFPMSSGSFFIGLQHAKDLLPPLPFLPIANWIAQFNNYLVDDLRWWTVVLTLAGALTVIVYGLLKSRQAFSEKFFLIVLVVYGFLIEFETIVLTYRPVTFFINMLPNYILLGMFFVWLKEKPVFRLLVPMTAFALSLIYFFYPPIRLGFYYMLNGEPLEMKYAETVKVPKYTRQAYHNIVEYIQAQSPADRPIIYAGYDSLIFWSAGRPSAFPEDYATFTRASFHPYHRGKPFAEAFYKNIEEKIVARIQSVSPSIILVPRNYLSKTNVEQSVFLQYLKSHWQSRKVLNADLKAGPWDKADLTVEVFFPIKAHASPLPSP